MKKYYVNWSVEGILSNWGVPFGRGGGGGGPPRTARQFDDVPLNVVFGEPVKTVVPGSIPPAGFFAGLGFLHPFAENLENSMFLDVLFAKTLEKNRVCCGKYWGAKGKCKDTYIRTYIHTLQYITLHYIT